MDEGRRVLVVGGAGYVGSVLVRKLLAAGYQVRVLDNLLFGHGASVAELLEEPAFSFEKGDLRDSGAVDRALDGVSDVVLLAALVGDPICKRFPEAARSVNGEGSMALFDALAGRGVERFVFTSTCSNYGLREDDSLATEEAELKPLSLYAETKVAFDEHALGRADEVDFCTTILRIATAYGLSARMRFDLTISEFTRELALGRELVVYDADTWRPYCHVASIAKAIRTVLEADRDAVHGEVFNVGDSEENYTKRRVVEAVQEHLGGDGQVTYTEGGSDPRNYRVSFDKIASQLGFQNEHTVPDAVGRLIAAIAAGAFDEVDARPSFYGNRAIEAIGGERG